MSTRGREGGSELPYTGPLGATRYEPAFLTGPDGVARRLDVVRGVNAATDPALAAAARDGSLNRVDDGVELAVPFIYHDPGARRFALVVPRARAHEELGLRAELLTRLAADASAPIPAYVREARAVIGAEGLVRFLRQPDPSARDAEADAEAAEELDSRLELVAHREDRLRDRAEDMLRREDELSHRAEELEVQKGDLAVREQELEQRLADLLAREEALASDEVALMANKNALAARERLIEARERNLAARERALGEGARRGGALATPPGSAGGGGGGQGDDEDTGMGTRQERGLEPLLEAEPIEPSEDEPLLEADGAGNADELEAESLDAGDMETAEPVEDGENDPTPLPGPMPIPPSPRTPSDHETLLASAQADSGRETLEPEEFEEVDSTPTGTPTADVPAAWVTRGQDAYAAVVDGEVRIWARGQASNAARLAQGGATLLLQADPDSPLPLAVLTVLASESGERFARAVLDITSPDDRAVLETLGRDFRVRLEVVSNGGRALGSYAVAAPGEANAQRALDVLAKRAAGSAEARNAEAERLARDGVRAVAEGEALERDLLDESRLASAQGAEAAVRAFAPLLDPATQDRLVLARGVPAARIDGLGKLVILAALRCGVELPAPLVRHAQKLGLAQDERALAARALTAYARTCESGPDAIGRTRREALSAWGPLLAWAQRTGASVPDAARGAVAALHDPDDPAAELPPDPRPVPTPEALAQMTDDELGRWTEHPGAREAVAREMARRDPSRHARALGRLLRSLPAEVAADVAWQLVRAGDALGDVWVEMLGSARPAAAAIAAVASAEIKLRRALNPLTQRALARDDTDWKLFGWAAGEFGVATVKALGRLDSADPDRLAWVLAHVVRAGGGREVERIRTGGGSPAQAEAATRAVGRVDEARSYDTALRHPRDGTAGAGAADAVAASAGERAARAMLGRVKGDAGAPEAADAKSAPSSA